MRSNEFEIALAPGAVGEELQRQGSVRRAREMLKSGERSEIPAQPPISECPRPLTVKGETVRQIHWPMLDDHDLSYSGLFVPKGPSSPMPRSPGDTATSSIYSDESDTKLASRAHNIKLPIPSFSHPLRVRQPLSYPSEEHISNLLNYAGEIGVTACQPPARGGHTRQFTDTSADAISDFPLRQETNPTLVNCGHGIQRPIKARISPVRTVSKEAHGSQAGSEVLNAYMGNATNSGESSVHNSDVLLRQASIGKRGKPSLRTIYRANTEHIPEQRANRFPMLEDTDDGQHNNNGTNFRDSSSSASLASSCGSNLEKKLPVAIAVHQGLSVKKYNAEVLKEELTTLPRSGPKMSDTRPNGPRPARLNLEAVHTAEARGSLTSLTDLVRRATKLAHRLDQGRTASRADLFDSKREPRHSAASRLRSSVSLSDLLASFPHPNSAPPEASSPWPAPAALKRLGGRNVQYIDLQSPAEGKFRRRCCGMRPGLFIFMIVLMVVIIMLSVLLPVFLVAVPRSRADNTSPCEKSMPCENGGVSVSSGSTCSCVCTNGFTGSQCMTEGDPSCAVLGVKGRNATVGSDLPRLFKDSQRDFNITLDAFSLMALFSKNNLSCITENSMVSFTGVPNKTKRFFVHPDILDLSEKDSPTMTERAPMQTRSLAARDSAMTINGIVIDAMPPTATYSAPSIISATTAITTRTAIPLVSGPTQTAESSITSSSTAPATTSAARTSLATRNAVKFAQISVLYLFQQTGTLDATMKFSENMQQFLAGPLSSGHSAEYKMNLLDFGLLSNITVNFANFTIDLSDGNLIGGSQARLLF